MAGARRTLWPPLSPLKQILRPSCECCPPYICRKGVCAYILPDEGKIVGGGKISYSHNGDETLEVEKNG